MELWDEKWQTDEVQLHIQEDLLPFLPVLAPGVHGDAVCRSNGKDRVLFINTIVAANPGSGDVGRYLDSLPRNIRIIVPSVISSRLAGMLERRGFVYQEASTGWMREATNASSN